MRITSGKYCGLRVQCPPGEIRPAMDRMRESMFAILRDMQECSFLDLFAGSGIMALEAASRGAKKLYLVEKDKRKSKTLYANMKIAQEVEVKICIMDVQRFIRALPCAFDFIHLDPPFLFPNKELLLDILGRNPRMSKETLITIHYPKEDDLSEKIGNLKRYNLRQYGRSFLGFYRKE